MMRRHEKIGPQGTQAFELSEINRMIANEIIASQSSDAKMPALLGVSDDVLGHQHNLDKDKVEIGRRPTSDIVLNDLSVSAMHAQVVREKDSWKVVNLLSSNGTFVNGKKVVTQILKVGDLIAFAGPEFVFSMVEEEDVRTGSSSSVVFGLAVTGGAMVLAFSTLLYYVA